MRLDSGDLAYLSREARRMFDAAGFPRVRIVASNELDEFVIRSIREEGGKVDIYGVETRLATAGGAGGGALGGGYKLVRYAGTLRLKVTSDIAKAPLPGNPSRYNRVPDDCDVEDIRSVVMDRGRIVGELPDLESWAKRSGEQLQCLPAGTLRLHNLYRYKVSISPAIHHQRMQLMAPFSS